MDVKVAYLFWNSFLMASRGAQITVLISIVVAIGLVLVFVSSVVKYIMQSVLDPVLKNFVGVIGREISKGMKNGSSVERADYIAGLLCAFVWIVFAIILADKNITVGMILTMIICFMVSVISILVISVWLVSMEKSKRDVLSENDRNA